MAEHIQIGDIAPRIRYSGDGVQVAFTYPFPIFADADLEVYVGGALQTLSADYTVAGAGQSAGGTVTFAAAPADGDAVTLVRRLAIQRTTDFQPSGEFRAKVINDELDYQTAALQQIADDQTRSARLARDDADADLELPAKAARAGKVLGFDADGDVTVSTEDLTEIEGAATSAAQAAASAANAAASETTAATAAAAAQASATAAAASAASNLFATIVEVSDADSPYTVTADTDDGTMFIVDTSAGDVTFVLPSIAAAGEGERYGFIRESAANDVILQRDGSDTMNGVSGNYTMARQVNELVGIFADEATPDNWVVIPWTQADADGDFTSKAGSVITTTAKQRAYDLAIEAGFRNGAAENLAVRAYGHVVLARALVFEDVHLHAETAPTGAALRVDIKKNGVTLFSTAPEIDAGANADDGNHVFAVTTAAAGDRLVFEVTQVGATAPGAGLMLTLQGRIG